ncbi:hypothetical protein [Shinella zoogloeoides]|uniref:hypothetical protein n=1 Tax=Shinella zoogloeoides TaxID=352475 RepID=UPI00299F07AC|nr:hypothetical protein [Shinella zoogloeoides]WPE22432.1 hypothetical protein ShzoTeo12_36480 [Shinella zoogloeoides]
MTATFTGYIIAASDWPDDVKLAMGKSTIAASTPDAWRRHVGHERAASLDFPIYVQRWSDMGYKPFRVTLTLDNSPDQLDVMAEILRKQAVRPRGIQPVPRKEPRE